jgi:two-component system OmpR family response regulator
MPRILIVDDDPALRDVVRIALTRAGFDTIEAPDGPTALQTFESTLPDLIILDVMLPEMEGTDVCRALRRRSAVPILFLSSRDDELDKIVGLEIGGDDYMVKPFSPRELVARVRVLLRRATTPEPSSTALSHGRLVLDLQTLRVTWSGAEIALSATELGILRTLITRPGRVFSREELMDRAYATERIVSDRTIDSHVRRIRAKFAAFGAEPIETLAGFGYRLSNCNE